MNALLSSRRSAIVDLCQRHGVHRLDLFGSATVQEAPADYDFLVDFGALQEGYANAYFGLLEGLQGLLDAPVDLVVDAAIRNPYFRRSIERQRVALYAA
ncbi:MAG: hypothetical protein JSS45_00520 [Proteobacteria bacterium]|nr:hypothetical protein [Pseudomonadota bacterium]